MSALNWQTQPDPPAPLPWVYMAAPSETTSYLLYTVAGGAIMAVLQEQVGTMFNNIQLVGATDLNTAQQLCQEDWDSGQRT
jgi:hypothetical protein